MKRTTKKKLRKALLYMCSAVMLVCLTVGATVAYLTDTEAVTNTFTVGKVEIALDEKDITKTDGTRNQKNDYTNVKPGDTLDKDPIVWVKNDSEKVYVFIKVENGLYGLEAGLGVEDTATPSIHEQIKDAGWSVLKDLSTTTSSNGAISSTAVYYKDVDVSAVNGWTTSASRGGYKGLDTFKNVYINSAATNDATAALNLGDYDEAEIVVTAYAIQYEGFEDADDAWDAGNQTLDEGGWLPNPTEAPAEG